MQWLNQNWVVAIATLLNALLVGFQVRLANRRNEYDAIQHANDRFRDRLPAAADGGAAAFYRIRYRFKGDDVTGPTPVNPDWGRVGYERSLLARIDAVSRLSDKDRQADLVHVERMVNKLNDLAETIDFSFIDHRKMLAKYHLAIIRDVFIVEPYIYYQVIFAGRNRWGHRVLQLGDIARRYNDINPIHRKNVYFIKDRRDDDRYGRIYSAPHSPLLWVFRIAWRVRRHSVGYPSITQRAKRKQNKLIARFEDETRQLRSRPIESVAYTGES